MKLSEWAKNQGIHYKTAWRWFHAGTLPVPAEQTDTGTILVYPEKEINLPKETKTVLYARVSSHDQKESLENQLERMRRFASAKGWVVSDEYREIGSGLNDRRSKLLKILSDPSIHRIIVEHRDRLARFGVPLLEASLSSQNREIVVINESEFEEDLWRDFVDVVTSMCARIYGKRSARIRAEKVMEALEESE